MRSAFFLALASLVIAATGCGGGGAPGIEAKAAPTGGTMFPLDGGRGYFEIASEITPGKARVRTSTINATFYEPDGKTPMAAPPTDVVAILGEGADSKPIPLTPRSGGKFASEPSSYPEGLRGTLQAKLGGSPVQGTFSVR